MSVATAQPSEPDASQQAPVAEPVQAPDAGAPESPPAVRAPELVEFVEATYPQAAQSQGLTADVLLELSIDATGQVGEVAVVQPVGHGFDEAARDAALRFRFTPAYRGDQAVASRIRYTYSFAAPEPVAAPADAPADPDGGLTSVPVPPEPAPEAEDAAVMEVTVARGSEAQQLARSARAVTVIETEEAQREAADLGDVLSRAEGVTVQREGSLGSRARISLNGLSEQQVRIFLDGLPLELSGFPLGLSNVPVEFVDRLDIYRGVVPIQLGANALGGAINLITDDDVYGTHARASYTGGSFDTHRVALSARHLQEPSGFFSRARAFVDHARNDYPVDVEAPDETGREQPVTVHRFHDAYDAYGVSLELGLVDRPHAERLIARGFYSDGERDLQHNPRMVVPYGEVEFGRRSAGAQLRYAHPLTSRARLEAAAGYALLETHFRDMGTCRYDWFGRCSFELKQPGEIGPLPFDQLIREHAPYARLQLTWSPAADHVLRFALSPNYASRTGNDKAVTPGEYDALDADRWVFNGVAGVEYEWQGFDGRLENVAFVKGYSLLLGAREQLPNGNLRDVDRSRYVPGGGDSLRWSFLPNLYAKTSYEYATRLPTSNELFGEGGNTEANFHLQPEVSHNLNLSLTLEDTPIGYGDVRLNVGGFGRLVDDMIVRLGDQTFKHENVQAARVLGVESGAGWTSPGEYVEISGTFTWQDPRNMSTQEPYARFKGDRLTNWPYMFSDLQSRLRWPRPFASSDALSLSWRVHYVHSFSYEWESIAEAADRPPLGTPTQLTHTLVATYAIDLGARALSASIDVQNLTDARVYDLYGLQKPGRAVYAKLALSL